MTQADAGETRQLLYFLPVSGVEDRATDFVLVPYFKPIHRLDVDRVLGCRHRQCTIGPVCRNRIFPDPGA